MPRGGALAILALLPSGPFPTSPNRATLVHGLTKLPSGPSYYRPSVIPASSRQQPLQTRLRKAQFAHPHIEGERCCGPPVFAALGIRDRPIFCPVDPRLVARAQGRSAAWRRFGTEPQPSSQ